MPIAGLPEFCLADGMPELAIADVARRIRNSDNNWRETRIFSSLQRRGRIVLFLEDLFPVALACRKRRFLRWGMLKLAFA